ncbi:MAG: hypothetical protein JW384_04335 [Nitrosomonadaceae bacterium]|nr:hypothetical protein [Nitrosomonadaceae bacterium]
MNVHYVVPPCQGASSKLGKSDQDKQAIAKHIVKFRATVMIDGNPVDLNSLKCVPLWASIIYKADHVDAHACMHKGFCRPARPWVAGERRK